MKRNLRKLLVSALMLGLIGSWTDGLQASAGRSDDAFNIIISRVGGAYLLFAGKFGGEVSKKEIESQHELTVEGCAKGSKIFKYTLVVTKGGQSSTYQSSSAMLTSEMQTKLRSLSAGDSFEFSQVRAYLPNGKDVVDVSAKKFFVI